MTLNTDIPVLYCFMRSEYLYNLESHHGETVPVAVFGVCSLQGRALGFHVMTDAGAVIWRVPIVALVHKQDAPLLSLDTLELWDCLSYELSVTTFEHLSHVRCRVRLKDRVVYPATYLFTVDWYGSHYAENPGDGGHKCGHILKLDNGCYACQPNNRILWSDPALITKPFIAVPDYKTNNHIFKVEDGLKWAASDDDRMFYDIVKKEPAQ
jgi:hypothetical protein